MITVRDNDVDMKKVNDSLQNASQETQQKIYKLQSFRPEEDSMIINLLEKQL